MSVYNESLKAELEKLEREYDKITDGSALIPYQEQGTVKYVFADGGHATNLEDAVKSATALVRFARRLRDDKPSPNTQP